MNPQDFSSAFFVKRGTNAVQEVAGLADAIDFLSEWPEDRRDVIHEPALRVCCEAHDKQKAVSVARNAFLGFAKRAGILKNVACAQQRPAWVAAACRCRLGRFCQVSA
ncbi:DUF982 domain-containing protein [Mesorhizobium sp. VK4C]|uniref:DUF982 domain-containing protein n=1 Tax=Mesorhizobium captivum TaxID=3072319 RepID=UPI002A24802F|nr:DUF982 domain-containing protein [Mesorhizobium sp. VK4C]MDX8502607.1 DUF982 domain-containing protein [Mesorhizobium sp. VK4C]